MEAQLSSSDAARLSPAFVMKFGRADETVLPLPVQAAEDDESLLLRTQAGDREALGILFQRYSRLIMSVGYRVLQDKSEAEDLLHDVFLFLINKSELFDPSRGTARSWLAKLTYHRALNLRKRLARCPTAISYCCSVIFLPVTGSVKDLLVYFMLCSIHGYGRSWSGRALAA